MLPTTTTQPSSLFKNEAQLCDFLRDKEGFWPKIGCETPKEWRTHTTPDFFCKIYRSKRKSDYMGVEVEMTPRCFDTHEHDAWNVHLLIVLHTSWFYRYHKNIPVLSLYRKDENTDQYLWSLDDDVSCLFHNRRSSLFEDAWYDREKK